MGKGRGQDVGQGVLVVPKTDTLKGKSGTLGGPKALNRKKLFRG